jgi:hypothetical protein
VDIFEKCDDDAKDSEHTLEGVLHEITLGPMNDHCLVRLIFRPGRTHGEKRAEEEANQKMQDEFLDLLGVE